MTTRIVHTAFLFFVITVFLFGRAGCVSQRAGFRVLGFRSLAPGFYCPVAFGVLVPCPGIEQAFPALEGRFLAPELPGKFHTGFLEP